ncbi:hypothetical protein [Campylobacter fetus]|uniref:hypothetical protein n=1 Tax=Campylobacter fetus TaxID=196 RepID=UPI00168D0D6E|nr:hypothetical protein [Campylobacter fetus]MBD3866393.1 hypothetical protein [Campylobacter fetus]
MDLSKLEINQKAILTGINGLKNTKRRFRSFRLDIGSKIQIKQKKHNKFKHRDTKRTRFNSFERE